MIRKLGYFLHVFRLDPKIRLADKERYIKVIVDEVIDWQPLTLRNDNTIVSTEPNYFWNGKTSSWDKKQ